ncbi:hypothetical protein GF371_03105 [Candidatus Woesearchaeota archaeon]|nr:hypothetical protein [Candidatus Woesearchaeota archaeon]
MENRNKRIFGIGILFLLLLVLQISAVSALCDTKFVRYYGACEYDGDIKVYDEQNNLIVTDLYGAEKGCFNNYFTVQVPGGDEEDCTVRTGETIRFELNTNELARAQWRPHPSVVNLDLGEVEKPLVPPAKKSYVVFVATLLAILIIFIIVYGAYHHYRKMHKKR